VCVPSRHWSARSPWDENRRLWSGGRCSDGTKTLDLAHEPLGEPPVRLEAEGHRLGLDPERLWILRHGETGPW
jgi:hypothetical protein